MHAKLILVSVN